MRGPSVNRSPRSGAEGSFELHLAMPRPWGSAPFRALNPMATVQRASGRAGGAFRGRGSGGRSPPGKTK
eukprot:12125190-Alexandrium_andersonii.AAC.1